MMDDATFVARFRDTTLPVDAFRHRDHVRMAWLYLREFGLETAAARFPADLRAFAQAHGVPGLYHATITWAYLALIDERMRAAPHDDWNTFATAHPELFAWKPGVLDRLYSTERLWSQAARDGFVLPDLH
jgi:hypothetical protein